MQHSSRTRSTSAAREVSTDSNPYSQLPILPEISQSLSSTKIQRPQHAKGASAPVLSSVMLGGIMMGIDLVGSSILQPTVCKADASTREQDFPFRFFFQHLAVTGNSIACLTGRRQAYLDILAKRRTACMVAHPLCAVKPMPLRRHRVMAHVAVTDCALFGPCLDLSNQCHYTSMRGQRG